MIVVVPLTDLCFERESHWSFVYLVCFLNAMRSNGLQLVALAKQQSIGKATTAAEDRPLW